MATTHLPVGFFGKLPVFADFISSNANGPELRIFHQWVQEGLYACKNNFPNWPEEFYKMPRYSFLFHAGSLERFIVGCFGASADQSGRKYPFSVFTLIKQTQIRTAITEIPLTFSKFLTEAYGLITGGWAGLDTKGLNNWVQSTSAVPDENEMGLQLSNTTLENFLSNVLGKFNDDRKYLLFQNIIDIFSPLRNRDTSRFTLGLRLPLSPEKEQWPLESAFWLNLIFRYLGQAQTEPVFFWNSDLTQYQPYLFLYLRSPVSKHFMQLVKPNIPNSSMCNLDEEGFDRIQEIKAQTPAPLKEWLNSPDLNLADFINNFNRESD